MRLEMDGILVVRFAADGRAWSTASGTRPERCPA